ncbi:MAG: hypothetical protein L6Q53_16380 [Candidatus Brocadia sinica]|nr:MULTISPECIES: hypothetical protein [Brocadia]MCK6469744.1 hypothetical protein [Candidatus Brocadia sinica]NUO05757.1 hypothetical protein [Candidatus Brocadia sinica]
MNYWKKDGVFPLQNAEKWMKEYLLMNNRWIAGKIPCAFKRRVPCGL